MKFFLFTSLLLVLTTEGVSHWGRCPVHPNDQHFNIKNYLGQWFEIARAKDDRSESGDCVKTNFDFIQENQIKVITTQYVAGQLEETEGQAYCEIEKPNQCHIKFFKFQPWKDYKIVYSAFNSYLLIHSCSSYLFGYSESFWLYSRNPHHYDINLIERIKQLGFGEDDIRMTNQTSCKF